MKELCDNVRDLSRTSPHPYNRSTSSGWGLCRWRWWSFRSNGQLTLTTANGDHDVNELDAGYCELVGRTTGQDTGSLEGGMMALGSVDRSLSVDGVSESTNDTPEQPQANWDTDNLASMLDGVAFLDEMIVTEDGETDVAGFQVETHSTGT